MTTPTAAPGWYPCPASPDTLRYYDGAAWTAHTAPAPPSAPVGPYGSAAGYAAQGYQPHPGAAAADSGPGNAMHWIVPVGRSGASIAAGYVGLVSLVVWPLGPVAVGLGIWGLRKARVGGHGSGRCIFAIVTGVIGSVLGVLMLGGALLAG